MGDTPLMQNSLEWISAWSVCLFPPPENRDKKVYGSDDCLASFPALSKGDPAQASSLPRKSPLLLRPAPGLRLALRVVDIFSNDQLIFL